MMATSTPLVHMIDLDQIDLEEGITVSGALAKAARNLCESWTELSNKNYRYSYFEAHSNGTLTGKPLKAGAIFSPFFDHSGCQTTTSSSNSRDSFMFGT